MTQCDFLLQLLHNRLLQNQDDSVDLNRRARRFMFKIVSETPVMPCSLIVTGVSVPAERDYIGSGGYGRVYKGNLHGAVVALKVLYKSDSNTVSPSHCFYSIISDFCFSRPSLERR